MRTLIYCSIAIGMLFCLLFTDPDPIDSCSASDIMIEVKQGASSLKIVGVGNAVVNYTETIDGYTVVRNNDWYEYAVKNKLGELVAGGVTAKNPEERNDSDNAYLEQLTTHLRHSKAVSNSMLRQSSSARDTEQNVTHFPNNGNRKVLVLLIQYPDLTQNYSKADFNNMMNQSNYNNTGSFRDYFLKNSYQKLDLNTDVFGWYTSQHNYLYYSNFNGSARAMELVAEALDAAEAAGVDFSKYDNDNDGELDGVVIVHSGPGAEVGAQNQYIWSQRNRLTAQYKRNYDGVLIEQFIINPETRPWGMVGIGVFCHEFGHLLGLPDLYDLDNSSSGIGNWGLMGKGSWLNAEKTPANLCAWSKEKQNWLTPTIITEGFHSLAPVDNNDKVYRINTEDASEYFLLENRQKVGNDQYLPGEGLAIWHIDTEKTSLFPGSNFVNIDEDHKGVDLEEADGLFYLDNAQGNGDAGDLYPGTLNNFTFNSSSNPSSALYGAANSQTSITNISMMNGNVSFMLNFNGPLPCAITDVVPRDNFNCNGGTFDLEMEVEYDYPAFDKKLYVNGHPFDLIGSPQKVFLENLPANGQKVSVEVSIGEDAECSYINEEIITAPMAYEIEIHTTTCNPDEVGIYAAYLSSVSGCDSIIITTAELVESYVEMLEATTCNPEEVGLDTTIYASQNGCDSMVITNFTLDQPEVGFDYQVNGLEVYFSNQTSAVDEFIWYFGDGAMSYEANPTHRYNTPDDYHVILQALRDDCSVEVMDEVNVQNGTVTGLDYSTLDALINVYPNPMIDRLNIVLSERLDEPMDIFLFDVSGQLLLSDNLEVGQLTTELEMKGIDAGAYWLELVSNNNSLVRQLIKL